MHTITSMIVSLIDIPDLGFKLRRGILSMNLTQTNIAILKFILYLDLFISYYVNHNYLCRHVERSKTQMLLI